MILLVNYLFYFYLKLIDKAVAIKVIDLKSLKD